MSLILKRHFWQSTAVIRVFEIFGLLRDCSFLTQEGGGGEGTGKKGGRLYFYYKHFIGAGERISSGL